MCIYLASTMPEGELGEASTMDNSSSETTLKNKRIGNCFFPTLKITIHSHCFVFLILMFQSYLTHRRCSLTHSKLHTILHVRYLSLSCQSFQSVIPLLAYSLFLLKLEFNSIYTCKMSISKWYVN